MKPQDFIVTEDLLASKDSRFINYLLDLIPQYAMFFVMVYLFFFIGEITGDYTLNNYIAELSTVGEYAMWYALMFVYYFVMENVTHRTFAKYVTKTIVVLHNGEKPKPKDILIRSFSRMIPLNGLSFLGVKGKGWHDSISKTYVVNIDRLEAKKRTQLELELIGVTPQED